MSGANYAHCDHCGTKIFYDADTEIGDAAIFHGECLPKHDAAVAARALREVVEIFDGDCIDLAEELRWTTDAPKGWSEGSVASATEATLLFGPWLTARANRIEREAGESDADA